MVVLAPIAASSPSKSKTKNPIAKLENFLGLKKATPEQLKKRDRKVTQAIGASLIAGSALATITTAGAAAPFVSPLVGAGALAVLAPETTRKIVSAPGAAEVLIAGKVAGAPGAIIVGAEKGVSILDQGADIVAEKIKDKAPDLSKAIAENSSAIATATAGAVAAISAATIAANSEFLDRATDIFSSSPASTVAPISPGAAPVPSQGLQPLPAGDSQDVIRGDFPVMPAPSTGEPKKKRKASKRKSEPVTVNVYCGSKSIKRRCH